MDYFFRCIAYLNLKIFLYTVYSKCYLLEVSLYIYSCTVYSTELCWKCFLAESPYKAVPQKLLVSFWPAKSLLVQLIIYKFIFGPK